mmetsp:Transcript_28482/g.82457  ORF Transcript_28482/g.82457 Transcript_28482/m.82457 type:complete len:141 (+) Transcript_28482:593-1015(+)
MGPEASESDTSKQRRQGALQSQQKLRHAQFHGDGHDRAKLPLAGFANRIESKRASTSAGGVMAPADGGMDACITLTLSFDRWNQKATVASMTPTSAATCSTNHSEESVNVATNTAPTGDATWSSGLARYTVCKPSPAKAI